MEDEVVVVVVGEQEQEEEEEDGGLRQEHTQEGESGWRRFRSIL